MANREIDLSSEETEVFIDLWEANKVLWDPSNKDYKSRNARARALEAISQLMGKRWTEEQVRRKIESLRAQYNRMKKKKPTGSDGGTWSTWIYFERIHSFLGRTEYNAEETDSNFKDQGYTDTDQDVEQIEDGDIETQEIQEKQPHVAHVTPTSKSTNMQQIQTGNNTPKTIRLLPELQIYQPFSMPANSQQQKRKAENVHTTKKRICESKSNVKANDKLEDAVINMAASYSNHCKERSSVSAFHNFGLSVTDRLSSMNDFQDIDERKKRVILARAMNKIQSVLFEAEMELSNA